MYIKFISILLNILIYFLMIIPVLIISSRKKIYNNRATFILNVCLATIIDILLSLLIYKYSEKIFRLFSKKFGIINYSVFISRIIFSTTSLFAVKIFAYTLLINKHKSIKKLLKFNTILLLALCLFGKIIKGTSGFYLAFPITDIIMYIIGIVVMYNTYKKTNKTPK